jgi:NAD(P)-dependent dehydrogenase (short-subunit alcohol dehydrogenase family)
MNGNRIVLITGANSGIGKAAAHRFAQAGWTVVMGCRDLDRSAPVQQEIVRKTGNPNVWLMALDMSSKASIHAFAAAFEAKHEKLDVLIHNAAYFNHGEAFRLTDDGLEITFATNVAGPHLLTALLEGSLKCSDDPRVLNAGSSIVKHFFSPRKALDLSTLKGVPGGAKAPKVYERYCQSKMALLMLTFVMARTHATEGIAVNCLQISGAKMSTETLRKFSLGYRIVAWIQNLFFPTTEFVADAYFQITTAERFRGVSGKYLNDRLEIMAPADNERVGLRQQMKHLTGGRHFPAYAEKTDVQAEVLAACEAFARTGADPDADGSSSPASAAA